MKLPGKFTTVVIVSDLVTDGMYSALDTSTEKDIQNALQHLVEGRSSLSIAHRLSVRNDLDDCVHGCSMLFHLDYQVR
jgi:ABC-type transport system involved in Fe-S cluster assembly fused permease/ATPase subunit